MLSLKVSTNIVKLVSTNTRNNSVVARVAKKGGEDSSKSSGTGDKAVFTTPPALSDLVQTKTSSEKTSTKNPSQNINIIPVGRWPEGIPPAMGGHFMPSGELAPLSKSKGPGVDIAPLYFTYPDATTDTQVIVHETAFSASSGLADAVADASAEAIARKGSFTIALSGGSLVKSLSSLVGREDIDFSKWYVLFSDERVVSLSSEDSNYKAAAEEFLNKVAIPSSQILKIKENMTAEQTAEHYAGQMLNLSDSVLPRTADHLPVLDLILLGVGPDGHVASLFPNSKETSTTSGWVLPVTHSPKPPSERITLTMPVINAAQNVIVCALGAGKAEIVQRALEVQSLPGAIPVQLVRPQKQLRWILDTESAGSLALDSWEDKKKYPRSTF
jgi:6-phosphogluconolactonase